jgi:hypothetical protein
MICRQYLGKSSRALKQTREAFDHGAKASMVVTGNPAMVPTM